MNRTRQRRKDNIRDAKRARGFSKEESLKMGFDMINFAIDMSRRAKVEED